MLSSRQKVVNMSLKSRKSLKCRHVVAQMTTIRANADNRANDDSQMSSKCRHFLLRLHYLFSLAILTKRQKQRSEVKLVADCVWTMQTCMWYPLLKENSDDGLTFSESHDWHRKLSFRGIASINPSASRTDRSFSMPSGLIVPCGPLSMKIQSWKVCEKVARSTKKAATLPCCPLTVS